MKVLHTPGPWFVEKQNYDSSAYYIRGSDAKGRPLTWGKGCVAHIPRSTVMPMEPNARLIAAAPDLLDSLVYLRNCIEDGQQPALREVNEAIRKATGEV